MKKSTDPLYSQNQSNSCWRYFTTSIVQLKSEMEPVKISSNRPDR